MSRISKSRMMRTARMAVETCAAVKASEQVGVITDTNKVRIAEVLAQVSRDSGAETVVATMTPRAMHGNEPPQAIAAVMRAVDVFLAPTTYALTHTDAMVAAGQAGTRAIIMRGITEDMMVRGAMTADYTLVRDQTTRVAQRMEATSIVHVTSPYGTDVTMDIAGRSAFVLAGFSLQPGGFAALPDGEAATSPVERATEGTIVFDQTMDGIGRLQEPITLIVRQGRVRDIQGGDEADQLKRLVDASDAGATNIAEFAIGTNPHALLIGNMAEDKKKEGSVHIAIGDNHRLGGHVTSSLHLDGLMVTPTVTFDGQTIIKNGQLLL